MSQSTSEVPPAKAFPFKESILFQSVCFIHQHQASRKKKNNYKKALKSVDKKDHHLFPTANPNHYPSAHIIQPHYPSPSSDS